MNTIVAKEASVCKQITDHSVLNNSLAPENRIRFAVNSAGKDKNWDYEQLATQFRDVEGSINDVIEHVLNGHALCAGVLGNRRRLKSNVLGAHWVLVDIDNSDVKRDESGALVKGEKVYKHQMTLEEALNHPFVQQHCALIYTTASHKPDWHKFRLIFPFPTFVEGADVVEQAIRLLLEQFPHDPACKDASRVFYGSSNAEVPLINANATLPSDWVKRARAAAEQSKLETEQRVKEMQKNRERYQQIAAYEGWDTDGVIEQALSYIPPRCPGSNNYGDCMKVLMALTSHYGAVQAEVIGERWSPSIPGDTWQVGKKIKSYKRDGVTIGTLFHIAKQYGFRFPAPKMPTGRGMGSNSLRLIKGGGSGGDDNPPADTSTIEEKIRQFLSKGATKVQLESFKIQLRLDYPHLTVSEINNYVASVVIEADIDDERDDAKKELARILNISASKLSLSDFLHPHLASAFNGLSDWMGVPAESFLVFLLPTCASLLHPKMRIVVNRSRQHREPFILYTALVSKSGSGKSPVQSAITSPLRNLQQEADERFGRESTRYEQDMQEWQQEKDGEPPQKPLRREFFVTNATMEALDEIRVSQGHIGAGFLYEKDELSGLFGSYGAYKGGRGDDKESVLSGYNGNGVKKHRAGGKRLYIPYDAMSITGGTQPGKLRKLMTDLEDEQGEWARFLFYPMVTEPKMRTIDEASFDISQLLESIYRRLMSIASGGIEEFTFNTEGKKAYQQYEYQLDVELHAEERDGIRAAIAKHKGASVRLAGMLYLLWCAVENKSPDAVIPAEFVQRGILLSKFFLNQIKLIYTNSGVTETQLAPQLASIVNLAQTSPNGRVSSRDASRRLKIKKGEILSLFRELEHMNYGTVDLKRQGFDFVLNNIYVLNINRVSPVSTECHLVGDTGISIQSKGLSSVSPVSPQNNPQFSTNSNSIHIEVGNTNIPVSPVSTECHQPGDTGISIQSKDLSPVSPVSPQNNPQFLNNSILIDVEEEYIGVREHGDTGDTGDTAQNSSSEQVSEIGECHRPGDTGDTATVNSSNNVGDTAIVNSLNFDIRGNAELMVSCLEYENGADQLRELMAGWTKSQMDEVRKIVHSWGRLDEVRNLLKKEPDSAPQASEPNSDKTLNFPSTAPSQAIEPTNEPSETISDKTLDVVSAPSSEGFAVGTRVTLKTYKDAHVGTVTFNAPQHGVVKVKWDCGQEKVVSISGLKIATEPTVEPPVEPINNTTPDLFGGTP